MLTDRVAAVQEALDATLAALGAPSAPLAVDAPVRRGSDLTAAVALGLFTDMVRSRELDVAARRLKAEGRSYYTIQSAGHELDAILGARLRLTDPCFLHYRSGGLMMARSRLDGEVDGVRDTLLSLCAAADDPISGGRHKVWGSQRLWVPPQTSTIASHVPKAMGTAFALGRAARLGLETPVPADAIVCCSFGDASANHASALAGINAARYAHRRGSPLPLLLVCEDNGLGISVDTPRDWIAGSFSALPHLRYLRAEGELDEVWAAVGEAIDRCRTARAPVFLHLPTVRLWGHAGSDLEGQYRDEGAVTADEDRDPLRAVARRLVALGVASGQQLAARVEAVRAEVAAATEWAASRPPLADRAAVVASLAPYDEAAVRGAATGSVVETDRRRAHHGGTLPEEQRGASRRTMAALLGASLSDTLLAHPEALVFGEDVGRKGGVYHVTAGLQEAFGQGRVFDTLLDETTILGVAQGAGLLGQLPIPEIQYLAYLRNAIDQLHGEASSLQFFSQGRFANPMVLRIAGLAYQKGFGGHFHNENAVGALRDVPGLALACPARADDAVRLLRGALAMARACGRVVALLEPIALYHEKDLHRPGDGGWLADYPAPGEVLLPGVVATYLLRPGVEEQEDRGADDPRRADVLIVSYANGLRLSLRAARRLADEDGLAVRVLDLRWLAPLPHAAVRAAVASAGAVLVADECRATGGGVADALVADLAEAGTPIPLASVRAADSYVPLGPAAAHVLLSEEEILAAARALIRRRWAPPEA